MLAPTSDCSGLVTTDMPYLGVYGQPRAFEECQDVTRVARVGDTPPTGLRANTVMRAAVRSVPHPKCRLSFGGSDTLLGTRGRWVSPQSPNCLSLVETEVSTLNHITTVDLKGNFTPAAAKGQLSYGLSILL